MRRKLGPKALFSYRFLRKQKRVVPRGDEKFDSTRRWGKAKEFSVPAALYPSASSNEVVSPWRLRCQNRASFIANVAVDFLKNVAF